MPSRRFKVVAGSVSVAVALGAGTSIAAVDSGTDVDDRLALDDVVPVSEVGSAPVTVDVSVAEFLASLDEDSYASPFDEDEALSAQETPESPDDSPQSVESTESPDDSPQSVESTESPDDSPQSVESTESPDDSPESVESPDESAESPDDSP
jgi:hypothetical protein